MIKTYKAAVYMRFAIDNQVSDGDRIDLSGTHEMEFSQINLMEQLTFWELLERRRLTRMATIVNANPNVCIKINK